MKIARYENKKNSAAHPAGELYIQITFSEKDFRALGEPRFVTVKREPSRSPHLFTVRAAERGTCVSPITAGTEPTWQARVWEPLFPGTKLFGAEEVDTVYDGAGVVLFEAPKMEFPVRNVGKRNYQKKEALQIRAALAYELTDAELAAMLRKRLQLNPRWRIVATEEGRNFRIDTGSL